MIAKRIFDLTLSAVGLLLLSPLLLIIAICVKLDSPGPVFFRQVRVGRGGKLFRIHKFRTMVDGAERKGLPLSTVRDSRITRVGAFLRRYKLDEFPQLIDVVVGEMSLVGARPEVPKYVACYPEHVRSIILSQPPGITDLAAIAFRNENELLASVKDAERYYIEQILPVKLKFYEAYAAKRTLWGDLVIICRTLTSILG